MIQYLGITGTGYICSFVIKQFLKKDYRLLMFLINLYHSKKCQQKSF
jgi:hypothetical protein